MSIRPLGYSRVANDENVPLPVNGSIPARRQAVGAVLLGSLVGLAASLDGRSFSAGAVAFVIALPVYGLSIALISDSQRLERRGLLLLAITLLVAGVVIIPLGISGRYPRRGGGGPSPSSAEPMAWLLGSLSAAALAVFVVATLRRRRRAPTD